MSVTRYFFFSNFEFRFLSFLNPTAIIGFVVLIDSRRRLVGERSRARVRRRHRPHYRAGRRLFSCEKEKH
jgi:hypothetical protein